MPSKLTIVDVQNFIKENDTEKVCTLLSKEYINSDTPLLFRCNICGQNFERDFHHLKRGRFMCQGCSKKNAKKPPNTLTFEDIKKYIYENDLKHECLLLSTEYINSKTPLQFKCNICGQMFERDANHLLKGRFRCPTCGKKAGASKLEYTVKDVKDTIEDDGLTLIGEYENASTGVLCRCARGHTFDLYFSEYLYRGRSCPQCAIIGRSGKNHPNYNGGGHQEAMDAFRHVIIPWKKKCLRKANYTCDITGQQGDIVIHHLHNFSEIVKQASTNTNIPIYNTIKEYTEEEREKLFIEILRLHEEDNGVVILRTLHNKFHSIYGTRNNTKEQYEQFKENYLNGAIKI